MPSAAQARIEVLIRAHNAAYAKDLKQMRALTKRQFGAMQRNAQRTFSAIRVGLGIAVSVGVRQLARSWGEYETAMSDVQAKTGATRQALIPLREEIQRVATATKFTLTETAQAATYLAQAGLDISAIQGAIAPVLDLAAATNSSAQIAGDIVTNIATPLGLLGDELIRVGDVVAATTASSMATIQDMGLTMSYAAPTFKGLNSTLEEGAAIIGTLAKAGIKGSRAGTFFRQSLVALAKGMEQVGEGADATESSLSNQAATLKRLGVRVRDETGGIRPFIDVLGDIANATTDAGDYISIFGSRAGITAQILAAEGIPALRQYATELTNVEGTAKRMAAIQMDNLSGDILLLGSQISGLSNTLKESGIYREMRRIIQAITRGIADLGPTLTTLGNAIATGMQVARLVLTHLIDQFAKLWEWASGPLFPLLGAALTVVLIKKIGVAASSIKAMSMAVALATQNVKFAYMMIYGPFVVAIGAAIYLILKFSNEIKAATYTLLDFFKYLGSAIATMFGNAKNTFMDFLGNLINKVLDSAAYVASKINKILPKSMQIDVSFATDQRWDTNAAASNIPMPEFSFGDSYNKNLAEMDGEATWLQSLTDQAMTAAKATSDAIQSFFSNMLLGGDSGQIMAMENYGSRSPAGPMMQAPGSSPAAPSSSPPSAGGSHPPLSSLNTVASASSPSGGHPITGGMDNPGPGTADATGGILGMANSTFAAISAGAAAAGNSVSSTFAASIDRTIDSFKDGKRGAVSALAELATMGAHHSKKLAKVMKAIAISDAIINTARGVSRAFAEHVFPASAGIAALVLAKGLAQVATIKKQPIAQAHAGLTDVPATGTYMLQQGERVLDSTLNTDLKQFIRQPKAPKPAPSIKNIYLEPSGMYQGNDLAAAFDSTPGTVILQSDVR